MKRPKTLSAAFVRTVTAPGRYGDGRGGFGLSLLVKPMANGRISKSWSQRLRLHGRAFNVGIGPSYPITSLATARAKALANARAIAEGRDPRGGGVPTFEAAAATVIALHEPTWKAGAKTAAMWRASLRDYAMPSLGAKPVNEITGSDVLAVLTPIWHAKPELARKVRQRIGTVLKWAVAEGHRPDNPAGDALSAVLPRNGTAKRHQRALPYADIAGALARVQASGAYRATALALEFLALTACRSGEVRLATWAEIDMDEALWTIPPERMKAKREHRVPLSGRALEILREAAELADGSGLVFASPRGKPLSDNTLSKTFRDLGVDGTPHGLRAGFRGWCAERTNAPRAVAEAALAHVVGNKVEAAYNRSDLLDRRRDLMEQWARYLAGPSGEVVPLRARK